MKRLAHLFALVLLTSGAAQAEVQVPRLSHRVTDLTATLAEQQSQSIESRLSAFEKSKGAQVAVLILPTTQPETIEQFGIRVMERWKLGRKGVDDGVLLLIAKQDRKLRIEVGYGLEGPLNDATAKRIIAEIITPHLKQGDYYAGINAGISAIFKVIAPDWQDAVSQGGSSEQGAESQKMMTPEEYEAYLRTQMSPEEYAAHAARQEQQRQEDLAREQELEFNNNFPNMMIAIIGTLMFSVLASIVLGQLMNRWGAALIISSVSSLGIWLIIESFLTALIAFAAIIPVSLFISGVIKKSGKISYSSSGSDYSSSYSSDSDSSSSDSFSGGGGDSGGGGASGDY